MVKAGWPAAYQWLLLWGKTLDSSVWGVCKTERIRSVYTSRVWQGKTAVEPQKWGKKLQRCLENAKLWSSFVTFSIEIVFSLFGNRDSWLVTMSGNVLLKYQNHFSSSYIRCSHMSSVTDTCLMYLLIDLQS